MDNPQIKCIISGKDTENTVSVFEEIVPPNAGPPLHTHEGQYEIFHVISGHIQFEIAGNRVDVHQGGVVTIPPGTAHAFINKHDDDSVIHFELFPSENVEVFFEKLVSGEVDNLPKLFEDHGMKLVGPPLG